MSPICAFETLFPQSCGNNMASSIFSETEQTIGATGGFKG